MIIFTLKSQRKVTKTLLQQQHEQSPMAMAQQPMAGPKAVRLAWGRVASTRALLNSDAKKIKRKKSNAKNSLGSI